MQMQHQHKIHQLVNISLFVGLYLPCYFAFGLTPRGVHSIDSWMQDASWKMGGGVIFSGGEFQTIKMHQIRFRRWGSLRCPPAP